MQPQITISRSPGAASLDPLSHSPNWHLQIARGSFVSVYGPRPSLAPHLLRAIASRDLSDVSGFGTLTISISGTEISRRSRKEHTGLVSYLPEDPETFFANLYVDEEIGFCLENFAQPIDQIRARVGEVAQSLEISNLLSSTIASLSGGQRQLVALAAALCTPADIILLEEPLSNLDEDNRGIVLRTLRRSCSVGKTILFSSVDWSEWTSGCDQLVVFDGARLAYSGSPISWTNIAAGEVANDAVASSMRVGSRQKPVISHEQGSKHLPRIVGLEDLGFRYAEQKKATIDGANIELELEEIVGLVGRNGSGKTTFAKILAGLLAPSKGRVIFRNFGVGSNAISAVYSFQNPKLQFLADSVSQEIGFPFSFSWKKKKMDLLVRKIIADFDLTGHEEQHPLQLDPLRQRQLVLAALMMTSPDLLIVDEPTNGLDTLEKRIIAEQIRAIHTSGIAVMVISHDQSTLASLATKTVLVGDGKILHL